MLAGSSNLGSGVEWYGLLCSLNNSSGFSYGPRACMVPVCVGSIHSGYWTNWFFPWARFALFERCLLFS